MVVIENVDVEKEFGKPEWNALVKNSLVKKHVRVQNQLFLNCSYRKLMLEFGVYLGKILRKENVILFIYGTSLHHRTLIESFIKSLCKSVSLTIGEHNGTDSNLKTGNEDVTEIGIENRIENEINKNENKNENKNKNKKNENDIRLITHESSHNIQLENGPCVVILETYEDIIRFCPNGSIVKPFRLFNVKYIEENSFKIATYLSKKSLNEDPSIIKEHQLCAFYSTDVKSLVSWFVHRSRVFLFDIEYRIKIIHFKDLFVSFLKQKIDGRNKVYTQWLNVVCIDIKEVYSMVPYLSKRVTVSSDGHFFEGLKIRSTFD